MRRLEDALFRMTAINRRSEGTQAALMALGNLVAWLVTNPNARKDLKPPPVISSDWLREADDGSAEFRIAAALAAIGLPAPERPELASAAQVDSRRPRHIASHRDARGRDAGRRSGPVGGGVPPMAAHFAPLDEEKFFYRGRLSARRAWSADDTPPTAVWGAGPLVPNLIAVLERRLVEAATRGLEDKPLAAATGARLGDVAAFLADDFDDARCAGLLAGLVWARPIRLRTTRTASGSSTVQIGRAHV